MRDAVQRRAGEKKKREQRERPAIPAVAAAASSSAVRIGVCQRSVGRCNLAAAICSGLPLLPPCRMRSSEHKSDAHPAHVLMHSSWLFHENSPRLAHAELLWFFLWVPWLDERFADWAFHDLLHCIEWPIDESSRMHWIDCIAARRAVENVSHAR